MHSVLSIDLCSEPARADVVQVMGRNITVLESRSGNLLDLSKSINEDDVDGGNKKEGEENSSDSYGRMRKGIKGLLSGLTGPWTSSVVIIPPEDYLSLNIDLPFSDPKHISKILPFEVQDRIPFPIADFLVEHHFLGPVAVNGTPPAGQNDIHVSIVPRAKIKEVLAACKANDLEPVILSTPTAVLGAIYYLAPEYFVQDSAVIYASEPNYYISIAIGGQLKLDRVVRKRTTTPSAENIAQGKSSDSEVEEQRARREILTELKLTLASFEHRYNHSVQKIYFMGGSYLRDDLQKTLSRPVEQVVLGTLMSSGQNQPFAEDSDKGSPGLGVLGAVFAQDINSPPILTNFRTQEFSYSPRLSEVFRGCRNIMPFALVALLMAALCMVLVYAIRARHISQMQESISTQIRSVIPEAELPEGLEVEALRGQLNKLQEQLKDLGSLSRFSPLDTLIQLTKDIPQGGGITFRSIQIKNNRVKIEGVAPDYGAIDNISKLLEAKKGTYARVKPEVSSSVTSGSNGRVFSLEIFMEG